MRKQQLIEKINNAPKVSKSNSTDHKYCDGVEIDGDCRTDFYLFEDLSVDIRHCLPAGAVTGDCRWTGEAKITICRDQYGNIEVNIEESVVGHQLDCVLDPALHSHDGFFDCEIEAVYQAYIAYTMPILLDIFETEDGIDISCEASNITIESRYIKDLCVIPCIEGKPKQQIMRLEQCGDEVACCMERKQWCKDEGGNILVTNLGREQYGEGCGGQPPSNCSIGEFPGQTWVECKPRTCIQH